MKPQKVQITTPLVSVNSTGGQKKKNRRRRRKNKGAVIVEEGGTVAHFSGRMPMPSVYPVSGVIRNEPFLNKYFESCPLSQDTVGFIHTNLDPCGEHQIARQCTKVPDGAVPFSAVLRYIMLVNVFPPFADPEVLDVTGRNWSCLFLLIPTVRFGAIALSHAKNREFNKTTMSYFYKSWNSNLTLGQPNTVYPNWVSTVDDPDFYYTLLQYSAFDGLEPPSELGISQEIAQFRFTGWGATIAHNTPDLFNQGVVACGQFNANVSLHSVDHSGSQVDVFMNVSGTGGNAAILVFSPALGGFPETTTIPVPGSTAVYTATETIFFGATQVAAPGEQFVIFTSGFPGATFTFQNQTLTINTQLFTGFQPTQSRTVQFRFVPVDVDDIKPTEGGFQVLAIPPVTLTQIAQANPGVEEQLLKECGGIYMPQRLFQPVFNMTEASARSRLLLADSQTTLTDSLDQIGGLPETVDRNYGIGVINMQSLPYSMAPYLKMVRFMEIVPTESSVYGPVADRTPAVDTTFLPIIKGFANVEPMAYPKSYNGLGLLFQEITDLVGKLPKIIQVVGGVSEAVAKAIDIARAKPQPAATSTRGTVNRRQGINC